MASYRIEPTQAGVHVQLAIAPEQQQAVLEALDECRSGRCSCPTREYDKLAGIQVTATPGAIAIDLGAKPDATIDAAAIAKCLDYTVAQAEESKD